MLFELGWTVYFALAGGLLLDRTGARLPTSFIAIFALPAGMLLSVFVLGLASMVSPVVRTATGLMVVAGLLFAVLLVLPLRRAGAGRNGARLIFAMVASLLPVAVAWLVFSVLDTGFLAGDTTIQAVLARNIVDYGWSGADVRSSLANWSYAYLFIQVLGATAGQVYFTLLQPVIASVTLLGFGLAVYHAMLPVSATGHSRLAVTGAAAGAVALTAAMLASCFYFALALSVLTSNLLLAGYSCLLALAALACRNGRISQRGGGVLVGICLAGIGLARIEGMVYMSFFALWMLSAQVLDRRHMLGAMVGSVVPVALVNLALILAAQGDYAQAPIVPAAAMAGIIAISLTWIPFLAFGVQRLPPSLPASAMAGLALVLGALAGVCLAVSSHSQQSFSAMLINLFSDNLWGPMPLILLGVSPLLIGWGRDRLVSTGLALGFALCCVILLLGLGRSPYYVDINDSAHRLLGSISLPMVLLLFVGAIRLFGGHAEESLSVEPDGP